MIKQKIRHFLAKPKEPYTIKPFRTDGCTAVPKGFFEKERLMLQCCYIHDKAYWKGGTRRERKEADLIFKKCIQELIGKNSGALLHFFVRIGGWAYWPTPFRWGYGWPYFRGYKPLSEKEKTDAESQLEQCETV